MANAENITRNTDHPNIQRPPCFWVEVTQPLQSRKRLIQPGEFIAIDPNGTPTDGRLVLIGDRLEMWNGQDHVEGVAVLMSTEDI